MSSIINFTPLYSVDPDQPLCSLLRIDEYTFLLDCGWSDNFNESLLSSLKSILSTTDIDAVLLSHADLAHIGALPYAVGKLGLNAPIYCTLPIYKLGQMTLYDALLNLTTITQESSTSPASSSASFTTFSFDDVDMAFDKMNQIEYSREITLPVKFTGTNNSTNASGITITPFAAGHTLGGTIWRITKESDSILYAVDINHTRERHLNGGVLDTFSRPTVLITDGFNGLTNVVPRKVKDQELMKQIHDTCFKQGGNVLIPSDAASRVLELLLLLHHHWELQQLNRPASSSHQPPIQLAFLSPQSHNILEFARTMIEWMSESCMKYFDQYRENPYRFPQLHVCHTVNEIKSLSKPFVVLATNATLSTGPSLQLLEWMSTDPRNLVVLTQRSPYDSVSHALAQLPTPASIQIPRRTTVPLQGDELEDWREKKRIAEEQAALESKVQVQEDSDSDMEDAGGAIGVGADSMAIENVRRASTSSSGGSSSSAKRRPSTSSTHSTSSIGSIHMSSVASSGSSKSSKHLMYPYYEPKRTWDVYGEVVDTKHLSRSATAHLDEAAAKAAADAGGGDRDRGRGESKSAESSSTLNRSAAAVAAAKSSSASASSSSSSSFSLPPSKTLIEYTALPISCRVYSIDLEGRSDGKSMKNIFSHVRPRKLILIHGSEGGKDEYKKYVERENIVGGGGGTRDGNVFIPQRNECVDITSESNVYRLQLHPSVVAGLRFVTVGEYDVAYTEAQIKASLQSAPIITPSPSTLLGPTASPSTSSSGLPSLHALSDNREVRGHAAVFLGDFRFTELKRLLTENGIQCEFYGGVLVCQGGLINIRKLGPTQISIQGAVSEDYYRIRTLLYSRYTIV